MTARWTGPVYHQLVEELGDVPEEVRTAADSILGELELTTGLSRASLRPAVASGSPPAANGSWFGRAAHPPVLDDH